MKRDECDGTLHEIPMREAPRRSKCYVLISTVTLCFQPCSSPRRTHHGRSLKMWAHTRQELKCVQADWLVHDRPVVKCNEVGGGGGHVRYSEKASVIETVSEPLSQLRH